MHNIPFWLYLLTSAGITYFIRMLPMVLMKKKIKNRFVLSFLSYMPYAVLTIMTIPAIFSSTANVISSAVGFAVAVALAYLEKSLVSVAAFSCAAVFVAEHVLQLI